MIFPVVSLPYATRVLGAENLGTVQYCLSFVGVFTMSAGLGINYYATREGAGLRGRRQELTAFFWEIVTINLISTALAYLVFFLLTGRSSLQSYRTLLYLCSVQTLFSTFSLDWLYQIEEDFRFLALRTIAFQVLSLVLMFLFVKNGRDTAAYAIVYDISVGGIFFSNFFRAGKYAGRMPSPGKLSLKKHLKPVFQVFGITVASSIYLNLDTVMLGSMRGSYEVGLYTAAGKLIGAIRLIADAVGLAFLTRLSYYVAKGQKASFHELLKEGMNAILMLSVPVSVGLICLSREILGFVFGMEYVQAYQALIILAVNLSLSIADGVLYSQLFLPLHMEGKACLSTAIGSAINVILNFFFVPMWGTCGVAATTLISETVVFFILLQFVKDRIRIRSLFSGIWEYFAASIVILPLTLLFDRLTGSYFLRILAVVTSSIAAYGFLLTKMHNKYFNALLRFIRRRNEDEEHVG